MTENTVTPEPTPADVAAPVPPAAPPEPPPAAPEAPAAEAPPEAPTLAGGPDHAEAPPPLPASPPEATEAKTKPEAPPGEQVKKSWYVVKVQSGREESIKEAIERRVKIEGLEEYFGQIIIPKELVTEVRNNKRIKKEKKLYPGYLMAEVEFNDRILYLFRETSGVGDFVGGSVHRPPPPMPPQEVARMLNRQGQMNEKLDVAKPEFEKGDRVKVRDGTFAGMEGEVKELLEAQGKVRVELTIFGRPVPVELEYWQVEPV
jgi:transcriptional antiterminator NusG